MNLLSPISPWHGLECEGSTDELNVLTGVIEITQETTGKMEMNKELEFNPVCFDTNKNKFTRKL